MAAAARRRLTPTWGLPICASGVATGGGGGIGLVTAEAFGNAAAAKRPRFRMHFPPTSSSWLNLVERFFADLTGDVIRAGSFTSVNDLVRDIKAYLAARSARRGQSVT
jgi:hypothetical protein